MISLLIEKSTIQAIYKYIQQNKLPVVGHQIKKLDLEYPNHIVSSAFIRGGDFSEDFPTPRVY